MAQGGGGATSRDVPIQVSDDIVDMESIKKMDTPKLKEGARGKVLGMRSVLNNTNQLLQQARDEDQDILKLNCISEKLIAIKGFLKVSEESYVGLTEAEGRKDRQAAEHHYKLVTISQQRVSSLGEEARLCIGEEILYTDTEELESTVPDTVANNPDDFVDRPGVWGNRSATPNTFDLVADNETIIMNRLPELTPVF